MATQFVGFQGQQPSLLHQRPFVLVGKQIYRTMGGGRETLYLIRFTGCVAPSHSQTFPLCKGPRKLKFVDMSALHHVTMLSNQCGSRNDLLHMCCREVEDTYVSKRRLLEAPGGREALEAFENNSPPQQPGEAPRIRRQT